MDLDMKRADGVLEVAAMMIVVDSGAEALSYGLRGLRILNERRRRGMLAAATIAPGGPVH